MKFYELGTGKDIYVRLSVIQGIIERPDGALLMLEGGKSVYVQGKAEFMWHILNLTTDKVDNFPYEGYPDGLSTSLPTRFWWQDDNPH